MPDLNFVPSGKRLTVVPAALYRHWSAATEIGLSLTSARKVRTALAVSRLAAGYVSGSTDVLSSSTTNSSRLGPTTSEPAGFSAIGASSTKGPPPTSGLVPEIASQPLQTSV